MQEKLCEESNINHRRSRVFRKKVLSIFFEKKFTVLCVDNDIKKIKTLDNLRLKNLYTFKCDISDENQIKNFSKI